MFKQSSIYTHLLSHQAEQAKAHECKLCGKRFSMPSKLKRHMLTHGQTESHRCPICPAVLGRMDDLRYHCKTKHKNVGSRVIKCRLMISIYFFISFSIEQWKNLELNFQNQYLVQSVVKVFVEPTSKNTWACTEVIIELGSVNSVRKLFTVSIICSGTCRCMVRRKSILARYVLQF